MEKNQIIGLLVMLTVITIYFTWFAPDPPPIQDTQETIAQDTTKVEPLPQSIEQPTQLSDSAKSKINELKYGLFSAAAQGEEKLITLSNDELSLTFNTRGGVIESAEVNNYKDYQGNPLLLTTRENSDFHLYVEHLGKSVDLNEFYYSSSQSTKGDTTLLSFQLNVSEYGWVRYVYSIPKSGFQIGFDIETSGMKDLVSERINYAWNQKYNRLELDIPDARNRSTVHYSTLSGDEDYLSQRNLELEEETLDEPIKWMSFKQKFFTSAIVADDSFRSGYVSTIVDESDTTVIKNGALQGLIPYEKFIAGTARFNYYFGPNDYDIMENVAPEFGNNVDMGWSILAGINKYFISYLFKFLEGIFSNYGVIIMIMVIIVRIILSPLTYKSHMSMAKMRVMKPELDELKSKHPDDPQKAQKEQMDLYRKVGINPLSGCIPMVLQMPILFSLFYFFPNAIKLRQESFLWSSDLSTYDNILDLPFTIPWYGDHVSLFTLLMTASTVLYTWSNSQITTVTGPMKTLQYVMPFMFLFFLNSFSSGLTFYYFVSNMSTFGQTFLFRRFIDESKIKSILDENKKKNANKKKSKFQLKMEEAMKQQKGQKKKKKR
ncbi:MAG: membrane protein insertase YidC [Cytophagales bacterium]|nr:membrane protein insertase YidC [Cytophagales bacterium]